MTRRPSLLISINKLWISINELVISINELMISIIHLLISIKMDGDAIFIDINKSFIDINKDGVAQISKTNAPMDAKELVGPRAYIRNVIVSELIFIMLQACLYNLTRFNKIAIQGTPQMAVD